MIGQGESEGCAVTSFGDRGESFFISSCCCNNMPQTEQFIRKKITFVLHNSEGGKSKTKAPGDFVRFLKWCLLVSLPGKRAGSNVSVFISCLPVQLSFCPRKWWRGLLWALGMLDFSTEVSLGLSCVRKWLSASVLKDLSGGCFSAPNRAQASCSGESKLWEQLWETCRHYKCGC